MITEEALRSFMQDYFRAMNAEDSSAIVEFVHFPFELKTKGKKLKLRDGADAVEAYSALKRIHAMRGVKRVYREVAMVHVTNMTEALVNVQETAVNASNEAIVSWQTSYLLARPNGVWRLTHMNSTNQDEAWAKRGEKPLHAAAVSSLC